MADKLEIYRGALRLLGPHEVASLVEDRPERLKLDEAWTPAVTYMLEKGLWNFAIRTVKVSANVAPFTRPGYDYQFDMPTDYVRLVSISNDATFREGLPDYEEEAGKWYANIPDLYIRYTSNGASYGLNIAAWPQRFAKALEAYLAFECGLPITDDRGNRNDLYTLHQKRLADAKILDAVDERVRYKPAGRVVRARFSGRNGRDG